MDCVLIKKAPEYSIEDGLVHTEYPESDLAPTCMSLRNFRIAHQRAGKMLAEHDSRNTEPIPIRRRKTGHQAAS